MEYLPIALSIVAAILVVIYYFTTRNHNLFKKHGILHIPPTPLFGNMGPLLRRQCTMHDFILKIYQLHPEAKYVGFYEFLTPVLMLRDPELIKAVTIKNAEQFPDHRPLVYEEMDPLLGGMLFTQRGDQWKEHRNMLSPTFTSSKIKGMYKLMSDCAVKFVNHLTKLPENEREMEMKSLLSKYTNDVIATCVYGVSVDTIKDPNNVFYVYGKIGTTFVTFKKSLTMLMHKNAPWLAKLLQFKYVESYVEKFFSDIVTETIEAREKSGAYRSDVIQLLLETNKKKELGKGMSVESMASHAFSFFFGGFDTVSSQTCIVTHLLAENPDVQERLQQEIDEALENNNGQLTYDALSEMKYLDAVMNESLRLHPVAIFIDRLCAKDFELPPALPGDKPFTVKKGMNVWIPVKAIHHDPQYYENSLKFDPDRFYKNGKKILNSDTYMPFGLGPRMCIGNRFALTEMKVLLCHLLAKCNVKIGPKTTTPLEFQKGVINATAKNGFWLIIEPRKSSYRFAQVNGGANGICTNGI